ncbi:transmembrane protein, putative [Medicago truncatula]|uniref:Transmembrane protein, putative n=1 Tax=Medicago truncatula TaxID=3880 RepID=G7IG67_MEDTR|nr:transmembrane protein, putative [Medicago truncatula]
MNQSTIGSEKERGCTKKTGEDPNPKRSYNGCRNITTLTIIHLSLVMILTVMVLHMSEWM